MDKTPPRNKLIALYTAISVVTLIALKPALDSYFDSMFRDASGRSLEVGRDLEDIDRTREQWAAREEHVAEAMDRLARQGRAAAPQLRPRPAQDVDPGSRHWNIMPERQRLLALPAPAPAVQPTPAAEAPQEVEQGQQQGVEQEAAQRGVELPAEPAEGTLVPEAAAPRRRPAPAAQAEAPTRRPRPARTASGGTAEATE